MRGFRLFLLAVVAAFWAGVLPAAAQSDARLKQAAQHFADLEDAQAKALLQELSAEGVAGADVLLGHLYSDPLFKQRDYEAAVTAFKKAAATGSEEAIFQLAESRYWDTYMAWTIAPEAEDLRPTAAEVFELLQRIAGEREPPFEGYNAAKWRLAWLCTFGGYDCGKTLRDGAVRAASLIGGDNLRAITASFGIMALERDGAVTDAAARKNYITIGLAYADPFVAALVSEPEWQDVLTPQQCLDAAASSGPARLMALQNRIAKKYEGRRDLNDCYDEEQLKELKKKLVSSLDYLARAFGYDTSWTLGICYQESEGRWFRDCVMNAVSDHFFVCTKLSMPHYFARFDIEYRRSKRYELCRELILSDSVVRNRL